MAKKIKKKIFVKIMSVLMLSVLFFCYTSICISGAQVDGYVLTDDRVTVDTKLIEQFSLNSPCDVALMIDFGYNNANPLIHTDRVKQLVGARQESQTFYAPSYYNNTYARLDTEIVNVSGSYTNQNIYANMGLSTIFHQTADFTIHSSVENGNRTSMPLYIPQFCDMWEFWDKNGALLNVPYGVLLSGENITLFPSLVDYYTNPVDFGNNGFDYLVFKQGIGGIGITGVDTTDYVNSKITYKIDYVLPDGTEINGSKMTIDGYTMYDGTWYTMRVPLIPTEWLNSLRGSYDYVTIKKVTATMSNNNIGSINPDRGTMVFYAMDSALLTSSNPQDTSNMPYDINATPEILANSQRYMLQNIIPQDGSWSGLTSWLSTAVGGFMDFEIGYGISIGGILAILVGFSFVMLFLKVFAGG